jgi:molecular chaperone IbpA
MTQLRTIDAAALAQLSRALVGFDRYVTAPHHQNGNYPPHNIVKYSDDKYGIEVAVAGFTKEEVTVEVDQDQLTIRVIKKRPDEGEVEYFKAHPKK